MRCLECSESIYESGKVKTLIFCSPLIQLFDILHDDSRPTVLAGIRLILSFVQKLKIKTRFTPRSAERCLSLTEFLSSFLARYGTGDANMTLKHLSRFNFNVQYVFNQVNPIEIECHFQECTSRFST